MAPIVSDNEEEKSPGVKEEPVPFSEYQDWRADEARERNRKRIREANRRDREICDHSRKFRNLQATARDKPFRLIGDSNNRRVLDSKQEETWSRGEKYLRYWRTFLEDMNPRKSSGDVSSPNYATLNSTPRETLVVNVRGQFWRRLCEMPSAMWVRRSGQTGGEVPSTSITGLPPPSKV